MKAFEVAYDTKLPNTLNFSADKGNWVTYTGRERVSSIFAINLEVNDLEKLQS